MSATTLGGPILCPVFPVAGPPLLVSNGDGDNYDLVRKHPVNDLVGKPVHEHTARALIRREWRANLRMVVDSSGRVGDSLEELTAESGALLLVPLNRGANSSPAA